MHNKRETSEEKKPFCILRLKLIFKQDMKKNNNNNTRCLALV